MVNVLKVPFVSAFGGRYCGVEHVGGLRPVGEPVGFRDLVDRSLQALHVGRTGTPFARTSSVMMFRASAISSRSSSTSSRTVSLWFSTCLIAPAGSFAGPPGTRAP